MHFHDHLIKLSVGKMKTTFKNWTMEKTTSFTVAFCWPSRIAWGTKYSLQQDWNLRSVPWHTSAQFPFYLPVKYFGIQNETGILYLSNMAAHRSFFRYITNKYPKLIPWLELKMALYLLSFQCFTEPFSLETLRWFAKVKRFLFKNYFVECSVVELTFFLMTSKLLIYITQTPLSGSKHFPAKLHRKETRRTTTTGILSAHQFCLKRCLSKGWKLLSKKASFFEFRKLFKFKKFFGKTLSRNNINWYAFYCKFATFADFEKNEFYGKFAIISWLKFSNSESSSGHSAWTIVE